MCCIFETEKGRSKGRMSEWQRWKRREREVKQEKEHIHLRLSWFNSSCWQPPPCAQKQTEKKREQDNQRNGRDKEEGKVKEFSYLCRSPPERPVAVLLCSGTQQHWNSKRETVLLRLGCVQTVGVSEVGGGYMWMRLCACFDTFVLIKHSYLFACKRVGAIARCDFGSYPARLWIGDSGFVTWFVRCCLLGLTVVIGFCHRMGWKFKLQQTLSNDSNLRCAVYWEVCKLLHCVSNWLFRLSRFVFFSSWCILIFLIPAFQQPQASLHTHLHTSFDCGCILFHTFVVVLVTCFIGWDKSVLKECSPALASFDCF